MRSHERIVDAIRRLETAMKYGPDMPTSRRLCVGDAIDLLEREIEESEAERAKASE